MGVIVSHSYANNKSIVVGVVEMSNDFLREPNYGVVHACHLWNKARKLDVLNHPKVDFACFPGQAKCCDAPYNHPYDP